MASSANRGPILLAGAIVLFVVCTFGVIVSPYTAQPASRLALTAALTEHRSVDLEPYRRFLGVDHAEYRGELRSDKAPGQPIYGIPFYAVGRALGAEPATDLRQTGDLGLWWQTLWSATIPFAALIALMYLAARRAGFAAALPAALALGLGTMMLPHAVHLYGHALAALCGFGAWMFLERSAVSARVLAIAGALAGYAVVVEYETAIVVAVLLAYAFVRHRRAAGWFLLGGVAPALLLAVYQNAAFGKPWHTPSTYYAGTLDGTTRGGYRVPGLSGFADVLAANRGLLIVSPIVLVALGAAAVAARRRDNPARDHALVALAIAVPYIVLAAGWSGTRLLEEPGPRYMIPALPFLAVPLAAAWDRMRLVARLAALWGVVLMASAALTYILVQVHDSPTRAYLGRVGRKDFAPTLWSMAFGRLGIVVYVATVIAAAAVLVRAWLRVHGDAAPAAAPVAVPA